MSVELLSPAGNLERLIFAVQYGADAVYFSYKNLGLRSNAQNFTLEEVETALNLLHEKDKKGYITLNIIAHNKDFDTIKDVIYKLADLKPDAFIVSDPGIIYFLKKSGISIPLHLSTQANTTNIYAVKYWETQNIKRIILARELTLEEIEYICKNTNVEIEVFVHGAMCLSYSGRCYLSKYLTNRDANLGDCSHPCRWKYYLMEETRQGEYFEVSQDKYGSYILNSKDLCLIEYIGKLAQAGVKAFKIEGRAKGIFYTSVVTGVYRKAIDKINKEGVSNYTISSEWYKMLNMIDARTYTSGFIDGNKLSEDTINYKSSTKKKGVDFLGYIMKQEDNCYLLYARAKVFKGEQLNILGPSLEIKSITLNDLLDSKGNVVNFTKPNETYIVENYPKKSLIFWGPLDNDHIEDYSVLFREK